MNTPDPKRCFYCKCSLCECKALCQYCGYALPNHNSVCITVELDTARQVNAKLIEALVQIRVHLACELQPGAHHTGFPLALATKALAEATK